jgi:alkylation response protein AidB-like acyl-CoA dehydrogenase
MSTRAEHIAKPGAGATSAPAASRERRAVDLHRPLTARTETGGRLVALAEELAAELAERAAEHDRDATYPFEAIDELRESGYLTAPIPAEYGGMGVSSIHDVVVASSRLAHGDASVAIGVNMHFAVLLNIARRWSIAVAAGNAKRIDALGASLESIVRDGTILAAAISEPGQDMTRPATTAVRTESGWVIDGRKIFATMSPAATALLTSVLLVDGDGSERYGYATVPTDADGLTVNDDWDAMGMRASGSNSVTLTDVTLPPGGVVGGFAAGDAVGYMGRNLPAGLLHAAAALGIAESAHRLATDALSRRGGGSDARARMLVAENAVQLSAARASLARGADLIDTHFQAHTASDGTATDIVGLFAESQATKTFVGGAAQGIVERALALSGGAGYLSGHPLGRAYRDVKAVSFMHPLGENRAYELAAQLALGEELSLH